MSDPVTTVTIKADASSYHSEITRASAATREITAELGAMKASGKVSAESQKRLAAEVDKAKASMDRAKAEAAGLSQKLEALKSSGKGSRSEIARLEKSVESAASRARIASSNLAKLGSDIASAGAKAQTSASGFESAGKAMSALKAAAVVGIASQAGEWLAEASEQSLRFAAAQRALKIDISGAQEAVGGLVSEYDLMVQANKAVQAGVVRTSEEYTKMASSAVRLGLANDRSARESMEDLTTALARGSSKVLDNLSIYLTAGEAQEEYARKIGKTTEELTENEKQQAFVVIGLERAADAADATGVTVEELSTGVAQATRVWDTMSAAMTDFAVSGASYVLLGLNAIGESLGDLAASASGVGDSMESLTQTAQRSAFVATRDATEITELMKAEGITVADLAGDYKNLGEMQAKVNALAAAKRAARDALDDEDIVVGYTTDEIRKIQEKKQRERDAAHRKAVSAEKKAAREMAQLQKEEDELVANAIKGIAAEAEARESVAEFFAVYEEEERQRIGLAQQQLDEELALLELRLGAAEEGSAQQIYLIDQKTAAQLAALELERQLTDDEIALAELATEQKRLQLENQLAHAKIAADREAKIQQQREKVYGAVAKEVAGAIGSAATAAMDAADGEEHAAARAVQGYAKSLRNKMIITAVTEAALAVASAASFNAVGAAAHGAAAVQAGAAAVVAAGVAGAAGSIAGPEASATTTDDYRGGTGGGASQTQSADTAGGSAAQRQDVPVSHDPITSGLKAVPEAPRQITVVLEGPIFAQDEAEVGRYIKRAVAAAEGYQ